jgi:hypothetical protein
MPRLHNKKRQNIGYVYGPQVNNDIGLQSKSRHTLMDKTNTVITENTGNNIDNIVKDIKFVSKGSSIQPSVGSGLGVAGSGLGVAGSGLGQGSPNSSCSSGVAGSGLGQGSPNSSCSSGVAGQGLGLIEKSKAKHLLNDGGDLRLKDRDIHKVDMSDPILPGDVLKKKLLKKMVRERKMKSLGDRVEQGPVGMGQGSPNSSRSSGMKGKGLVMPGTSSGLSKSKTLPGTKGYALSRDQSGGFIIAGLTALIAGISAAASAVAATTVVGTVTVGTLAGAVATGAAGAAGAAIVNKIAGKGIDKGDIKKKIIKAVESTKITLKDFPTKDKIKLKTAYEAYKKNPTKKGIEAFAKKMAPSARDIMKKKLTKKLNIMKIGSKIKTAFKGSGLNLSGQGQAKKFDDKFVKHFVGEMKKK